jgi:outer membrane protein OmpU
MVAAIANHGLRGEIECIPMPESPGLGWTFETTRENMKKLLLATALVSASAGFAAAEVTLSGDARMGLIYNGDKTLYTARARVKFNMVGTTDGGIEFGAGFRADQALLGVDTDDRQIDGVGAIGNTAMEAGSVYISGEFGKLTFGDNDSAANVLVGHVSGVGLTGLNDLNELRYLGQADTSVLFEYSTGAFSFAASMGQIDSDGEGRGDNPILFDGDSQAMSLAAKYATDTFSVALGWEDRNDITHLALGGSATFGSTTVKLVVSDTDIDGDDTQFALSGDFGVGDATKITAFITDEGSINNYGIGASYDLGGGASIVGGIARADGSVFSDTVVEAETFADIGISMSF